MVGYEVSGHSDRVSRTVVIEQRYGTGITVDTYHLTMFDPDGACTRSHHGRNTVFPGNDGTVTQDAAHVRYQSRCVGE